LVDHGFDFPQGGKMERQLSQFIQRFEKWCGGVFNTVRMVDYCVFQIHKNRTSPYQHKLAYSAFGVTAFQKYQKLSSKRKKYVEDRWLEGAGLNRSLLCSSISERREHPQAKYVYMAAEESTKKRFHNTEMGYALCCASTLMWSPLSDACSQCRYTDCCKEETARRYPELYRLRQEEI